LAGCILGRPTPDRTPSEGSSYHRDAQGCYPDRIAPARPLASLLAALLATACSSRAVGNDDPGSLDTPPDEPEPGDQPTEPGAMFSPCTRSAECAPQEFCVFPQGEAGYCTSACTAPTDPGNCDPPPGDQPPTCFDIGLTDGRWVCALDCVDAPCPRGMRCEAVATGDGERSLCF
jgi:hypothetical protein